LPLNVLLPLTPMTLTSKFLSSLIISLTSCFGIFNGWPSKIIKSPKSSFSWKPSLFPEKTKSLISFSIFSCAKLRVVISSKIKGIFFIINYLGFKLEHKQAL